MPSFSKGWTGGRRHQCCMGTRNGEYLGEELVLQKTLYLELKGTGNDKTRSWGE